MPNLYSVVLEGAKNGLHCELWKDEIDYGDYDPNENPWTKAAVDVAKELQVAKVEIDVYYGFNTVEIKVKKAV